MATLSKSKTLFAFTSPRTITKIIPEIELLVKNFENQEWNRKTQEDFFNKLCSSSFYESTSIPKSKDFAARDRITRAPKAFGFVDLKPVIKLTDAGRLLLSNKRVYETLTRQMLKFQLPSPYHLQSKHIEYNIRPYLELLRLVYDLKSLSKDEIALFFLEMTNVNLYEKIKNKILLFRENKIRKDTSYKQYVYQYFIEQIRSIYSQEIEDKDFKTRESTDDSFKRFIQTKRRNMLDYADAFFRYLRATELVTISKLTFRLVIAPSKKEEVEYLLKETPRNALKFKSESEYKKYLFNPFSIKLYTDNFNIISKKLQSIDPSLNVLNQTNIEELKDKYEFIAKKHKNLKITEAIQELKDYNKMSDVLSVFTRIKNKDVSDAPLFLEWNVWRSFVMLNHGKRIEGNFYLDLEGMPKNTAPGNVADIEVEFDDFALICEVTLSGGQTQFKMEGDSVPRHYGQFKRIINKECYCIFIAPKISEGTIAFFYNLNKTETSFYGGKTRIIPLSLDKFIEFYSIGIQNNFSNPKKLKNWLHKQWVFCGKAQNENEWMEHINNNVKYWIS